MHPRTTSEISWIIFIERIRAFDLNDVFHWTEQRSKARGRQSEGRECKNRITDNSYILFIIIIFFYLLQLVSLTYSILFLISCVIEYLWIHFPSSLLLVFIVVCNVLIFVYFRVLKINEFCCCYYTYKFILCFLPLMFSSSLILFYLTLLFASQFPIFLIFPFEPIYWIHFGLLYFHFVCQRKGQDKTSLYVIIFCCY